MLRVLVLMAGVAGLAGLVGGCGQSAETARSMSWESLEEIGRAVARQDDRVFADDLAGWLVAGQKDFLLVDIRARDEYVSGHIDSAQNIPLPELVKRSTLGGLPRDRRLLVYSADTENASKAVVMLRLAGLNAYGLVGGYNEWRRHIMNAEPIDPSQESLDEATHIALACLTRGEYDPASGLPYLGQPVRPTEAALTPDPTPVSETSSPLEEESESEEGLIIEEGC